MTPTASLDAAVDSSRLSALRADARRDPDRAMAQVAREFEALFVQMMMKSARDATPGVGMFDSHEMRLFQEMFDAQVALTMAEHGDLGFEDLLRAQLPAAGAPGVDTDTTRDLRALALPQRRAFPVQSERRRANANAGSTTALECAAGRPVRTAAAAGLAAARSGEIDLRQRRFLDDLRPHAERAARKLGTSPEILLAQAALETGWGRYVVGGNSNNLFSIKADRAWTGRTVTQRTLEFFDGKPVTVSAAFRAYRDVGAAFDDYVAFLQQNPRYERALQRAADPHAYVHELQRAGYATDSAYAHKILRIHGSLAGTVPPRG